MATDSSTMMTSTSKPPRRLAASAPPHGPASSSSTKPTGHHHPHQFLTYMHRPPRIVPNYGKRPRGVLPKSSVSRVLLYDNVTQQQMLHVKMTHLRAEQRKTGRLMDMHRKSFLTRRQQKERQMAETALHVDHDLLERGLLSANLIPRSTENRPRATETTRLFNPYTTAAVEAEANYDGADNIDAAQALEHHHVTPQQTNETTADDSVVAVNEGWAEEREGPVSVDRPRRAITSDCIPRSSLPAAKAGVHRTAHTAARMYEREMMMTREQGTLPDIHHAVSLGQPRGTAAAGKTLVDVQQQNGLTRILHTFHHQDSFDGGGRASWKGRGGWKTRGDSDSQGGGRASTADERYRKLERVLVRIEPPNEGYLELSPSFHSPRQTVSFTRPSSLHPSSSFYRRRSSSSSSSAGVTGPFTVHTVQDL